MLDLWGTSLFEMFVLYFFDKNPHAVVGNYMWTNTMPMPNPPMLCFMQLNNNIEKLVSAIYQLFMVYQNIINLIQILYMYSYLLS